MSDGILGKKMGMTQIFTKEGMATPVTVVETGSCYVVQEKTEARDGYYAVQLGFAWQKESRVNKPLRGHFAKAKLSPLRLLREIKPTQREKYKLGQQILVNDVLSVGDRLKIIGTSKGKGFAGVMKRWRFHGGRATHGSCFHRAPGAIGASADPARTAKGKKLPGRLGGKQVTIKGLKVVDIVPEKNLLLIKGAVPGPNGGLLIIKKEA